ncbi:hypothetical protein [Oscillatoria acuminata]|uniref:Uncharacterized protein n=1 Tax=Oscillatoria acuminata PCC 6304 TaxID=56110 RepID=K9TFS3_9CYAN|nr:hypothetical protein [Oscillatoria acuminata]AFY81722.1 hypothetical protein Oscil6304_2056 [Oscillatoria acuminata PCC 6304]
MIHRFWLVRRSRTNLSRLAVNGFLAATLGATTIACSQDVTSSPPSVPADEIEVPAEPLTEADKDRAETSAQLPDVAQMDVGDDGEPNELFTTSIERINLQPGAPYSEVRSLVMAEGWIPYTQAEGANPDVATLAVRELHELGFEEAQSCSGTGQGFCTFEFIFVNTEAFPDTRLVLITTPATSESNGEPLFYNWRIDGDVGGDDSVSSSVPANDRPNFSQLEANATYENQNFSPSLYTKVLEQEQDCVLIGEDCANARYLFQDSLLTFSKYGFGSTIIAVSPHDPVSRSEALTYAQILDADREIDFTNSNIEENNEGELPPAAVRVTESFFEADLPQDEPLAYNRSSTYMVQLISRPDEDISRIEFHIVIL